MTDITETLDGTKPADRKLDALPVIAYLRSGLENISEPTMNYLVTLKMCEINPCANITELSAVVEKSPALILIDAELFGCCCYKNLGVYDIINKNIDEQNASRFSVWVNNIKAN